MPYQISFQALTSSGRRVLLASLLGSSGGAVFNGCVSQMQCESPTDPCTETGGPVEAAATAVAAGALWAGGGGCAIAGCRPPFVCNKGSGLCEHLACGEGRASCPPGQACDSMTSTCR